MGIYLGSTVVCRTSTKLSWSHPSSVVAYLNEVGNPGRERDLKVVFPKQPGGSPWMNGQRPEISFYLGDNGHSCFLITGVAVGYPNEPIV